MTAPTQTCYRHADRRAGVSCQRCGRPICPHCMTQASVGFHCPECLRATRQRVVTPRELRHRARPLVTQALVAINVAVYLLDWLLHGDPSTGLQRSGAWTITGGLFGPDVYNGEWYRLVTSAFLHENLAHLGLNMLSLWFIGSQLEPLMGRLRFGLSYAVGLAAGSFGALLIEPHDLVVGASGAIFGLFVVVIALQVSRKVSIWQSGVGALLVINILFSFAPGIAKGAHFGGLAGGLLVGWIFFWLEPRLPDKAVSLLLATALAVGFLVGAAAIAQPLPL